MSPDAVPTETRDVLARLGVTRTYVIGGTNVISDAVLAGLPSPTRLAGRGRRADDGPLGGEAALSRRVGQRACEAF